MAATQSVDVESDWRILPDRVAVARAESPQTCITIPVPTPAARQVVTREHAGH